MAIHWRREADNIIDASSLFANSDSVIDTTNFIDNEIQSDDSDAMAVSSKLFGLVFKQDTDGNDITEFCNIVQHAFFPSGSIIVNSKTLLTDTYLLLYYKDNYKDVRISKGMTLPPLVFKNTTQLERSLLAFLLNLIYNEKIVGQENGKIVKYHKGIIIKPKQKPTFVTVFDSFSTGEICLEQLKLLNTLGNGRTEKEFMTSRYALLHFFAEQAHAYFAGRKQMPTALGSGDVEFSTSDLSTSDLMHHLFYEAAHEHALKATTHYLKVEHLDGKVNEIERIYHLHLVEAVDRPKSIAKYITTYIFKFEKTDNGTYSPLISLTKESLWDKDKISKSEAGKL